MQSALHLIRLIRAGKIPAPRLDHLQQRRVIRCRLKQLCLPAFHKLLEQFILREQILSALLYVRNPTQKLVVVAPVKL